MLKPIDPLIRRLISGTLFAVAFVWLAVSHFNVDPEVIRVLFIFSIVFVVGLAIPGLIGAFLLRWFRRGSGGMLDHLDEPHEEDKRDED
ncbi:MAG: hypothetical protein WD002_07545 [Pseudomonadales bacterium]